MRNIINLDDFDSNIEKVKESYHKIQLINDHLRKENENLKTEHYKDKELYDLKRKNDILSTRCSHFGMNESDYTELISWWNNHIKDKHIITTDEISAIPSYNFEFTDNAVCTCYSIKCDKCGEYHNIFQ